MLLTRVVGKVVCPRRAEALRGSPLKVVQVVGAGLVGKDEYYVAADPLGVSVGQLVFTSSGASARRAEGLTGLPIDLAVVGVVERIAGQPDMEYQE